MTEDLLDLLGRLCLTLAVVLLARRAAIADNEIRRLRADTDYLYDHAVTREDEVRPT